MSYKNTAKSLIPTIIKDSVTIYDVVTLAMATVEKVEGGKLTGDEKKNLVTTLLPGMVDVLVKSGRISKQEGKTLKEEIKNNSQYIVDFIDVAVRISNNPNVINAEKWVRKKARSCFPCCK